ncbi:MAG: HAMP domain-containing sensor histidine kinase [Planctomycetota bacterium]|nr:HAMP domain-containing sensor histidine kinase [Planctomycetota bacterium]
METIRILVVDDEAGMRMGAERALRNFHVHLNEFAEDVGFEIRLAATGEEALEAIAAQAPDILLLDHKLPGISGLDILETLHGRQDEILTVMITAYASLETAVTATRRGAYDFLAKPFTPEELTGVVRKATRHLLLQRQARRLAEEKRRVRFEFISVLAHELKSPLNAVDGYLRIVRDRGAGNDQAVYDRMIARSLVRLDGMRKMILDLLDLTRIESGTRKREISEVDLSALAAEALETSAPGAAEGNIALHLHAPGRVVFPGDRDELAIVLNNLVSNAVKYNRQGGQVDVTLAADPAAVTLTVADTGIGMTSEESAHLFGEFSRIKNAKTRDILGSGLGLSIVKKLVTLYNGTVTVDSTPDVGTTFTVALPRSAG